MKTVRGTVIERIEVVEETWGVDAVCDECLKDEKVRPRPEKPSLDDTYERSTPAAEAGTSLRNKIRNRVVSTVDGRSAVTG